jgi:hypothetical protein
MLVDECVLVNEPAWGFLSFSHCFIRHGRPMIHIALFSCALEPAVLISVIVGL